MPGARARVERDRVPARARRRASRGGRSRSHTSITLLRRDLLALVRDARGCAPRPRRGARCAGPSGATRRRSRRSRCRCRRAVWVYSSASSYGSSHATWSSLVEPRRRGTAGPGGGTRAPGCATANTRASSTVPIVALALVVDEVVLDRRYRCAARRRAAGRSRPAQYILPPRGVSRSSSTSSRTASSSPSPNQRSSSARAGARAPRTRPAPRSTNGLCGVDDRALGLAAGELGRVRDVPLVELVVAGDEHARPSAGPCARRARPAATSTRACRGSR